MNTNKSSLLFDYLFVCLIILFFARTANKPNASGPLDVAPVHDRGAPD